MENIKIHNKNIAEYVMFKLNKIDNVFKEEELRTITEITIEFEDECDDSILEEISLFKNLNNITIKNLFIYNKEFAILKSFEKLDSIDFVNCEFENADLIASLSLNSISLINCNINSYFFISALKEVEKLSIVNGQVKIGQINTLTNLKYLELSGTKIMDIKELNLNQLEELYVDNTNIDNFSFLSNLTKLKKLSIDELQYMKNISLLNVYMSKNLKIYNENIVEIERDEVDVELLS